MRTIILVLFLMCISLSNYAQEDNAPANLIEQPSTNILDSIDHDLMKSISQFGGVTLAILFGVATAFLKKKKEELSNRLSAIIEPAKVAPDEIANSIMLLGLGGSGKTSLIKALTNDNLADPRAETADYRIFSVSIDLPGDGSPKTRCKLFISDYIGQNLGSLIRAFIEQQQIEYSPMRYGYVNSLILVLDIFPPPQLADTKSTKSTKPDKDRIQNNIDAWNDQVLSAVYGLLTPSLKYVCIFINKTDLLVNNSDNMIENIRSNYESIRRLISQRSRGARVETIVGSAETGEGVNILKQNLIEVSCAEDGS